MAVTRRTEQPLALDEFLQLPEEKPALEYRDGVVKQKMAPLGEHSVLQSELLRLLDRVALMGQIGKAFPELRCTFDGASYVPDISVYRRERIPRTQTGRVADHFLIPPDVAVEIRSPGQTTGALSKRCAWYVEHGVQVALLVDGRDESVLAFRPGKAVQTIRDQGMIELDELTPGARLAVREIFSALIID